MQLHTVHKKEPMKKFVGRKRKAAKEEGEKHHLVTVCRAQNDLVTGKTTSMDSGRNTNFLALDRSPFVIADVDQPMVVPLLVECFIIGRRSTMSFTHMQREQFRAESARQWRAVAGKVRKEEEEVAVAKSNYRVKSEGEKGFTLKYASIEEVVGHDMVHKVEAVAHLCTKN
jgi:hypothetical protein